MKSIATVNFKGGVGKTTITWLLAKYAAERRKRKILVIDTDAQMSLTLAVQLHEDTGTLDKDFEQWYENRHKKKKKTILNALEKYELMEKGHFDFPIDSSFIYQITDNLHFVPSVIDLYWLELDVFDRDKVKNFIRALLGKIEHSRRFNYDYVFFDCPPNFTALSYSVLSCCSLILIPVNPDIFAPRGVEMMLDGLELRIQPWPDPKIGVFMNRVRLYKNSPTREAQRYWEEVKRICEEKKTKGMKIEAWDVFIPERVNIKRAIPGGYFPEEFESDFSKLWDNIEKTLR